MVSVRTEYERYMDSIERLRTMSTIEIGNAGDVVERKVNKYGTVTGLKRYVGCTVKVVVTGSRTLVKSDNRSCKTCKYQDGPEFDGPCLGCCEFKHWELAEGAD
jgi:hypothetical protein